MILFLWCLGFVLTVSSAFGTLHYALAGQWGAATFYLLLTWFMCKVAKALIGE